MKDKEDLKNVPEKWSFPFLNSFAPWSMNLPSSTTIAYWMGVFKRDDLRVKLPLDYTWHSLMSLQISREEQAAVPEDLRPFPEVIPDLFQPFAPVAFTRAWSPFPFLCNRFGSPDEASLDDSGNALAFWAKAQDWKPLAFAPPDAAHFEAILRTTQEKATEMNAGLLVIAAPGWSYDNDELKGMRVIHKLMRSCGYEVVTRTPLKR